MQVGNYKKKLQIKELSNLHKIDKNKQKNK